MTDDDPNRRRFDQILVVADRAPVAGRWGRDRRVLQLVLDLRALCPTARLVLLTTDGVVTQAADWAAPANVELVGRPVDAGCWLQQQRLAFSLIVQTGAASAASTSSAIRSHHPQAVTAGLLSTLAPLTERAEDRFVDPDERHGALLFARASEARVAQQVAPLDAVLVLDDVEARRATELSGRVRTIAYPPATRASASRPPADARAGALSWARFANEPGEPDEEATFGTVEVVAPLLRALAPGLPIDVSLEFAPRGWKAFAAQPADLYEPLRRHAVLILARPFGVRTDAESLLLEAADAGTPVVTLRGALDDGAPATAGADLQEVARHAATLMTDAAAWSEARTALDRWWEERHRPERLLPLASFLASAGMVGRPPGVVSVPPEEQAGVRAGRHTIQGQVQSQGWSERRPIEIPFLRAELTADQLWPHIAYDAWYTAHPLPETGAAAQRSSAGSLESHPLISLVMPVYNTDPEVLRASIESVLDQTYPLWELCAVDDGSTDPDTVRTLDELAATDPRILVRHLDTNVGIVGASNVALAMANGEFVGLLDHDDLLTPDALHEMVVLTNEEPDLDYIYSDEDKVDEDGHRSTPFFKPSWSPHLHLCVNYVTHFSVYRQALLATIGGFREGFDGSQDYDLSLRATERARRIGHLAKPVYGWRMVPGSTSVAHDAKPYALEAARKALDEAIERRGSVGYVERGLVPGTWRPRFKIVGDPLVSILIPTRNGRALLERCIDTVLEKTKYRNFEIIIIDNGSDQAETLQYLATTPHRVLRYPYRFNYARQMNLGVEAAEGEFLLFLNNDVELITPGWLDAMVELGQQPDVGAVGARLLFPTGRPQHEGVFVGYGGGSAGNVDFGGYFGMGQMIREATAVTAACMLMRPEPFRAVGGFDERLRVAFNDVDLCLRLRERGYRILYTPYAEFFHAESASRGKLHPEEDEAFFVRRWGPASDLRDPFYNPNLDPVRPFRLRRGVTSS